MFNLSAVLNVVGVNTSAINNSINQLNAKLKSGSVDADTYATKIGLKGVNLLPYTIASAAILKLSMVLSAGIKEAIRFEYEISHIAQTLNISNKQAQQETKFIGKLSQQYGLSATKIAETTRVLAQAGYTMGKLEEATKALAQSTLLASFDNLTDTTDGLISIQAQFQSEMLKSGEVIALVNTVAKKYAVEAGDLFEVARKAGGAFAATGGTLKELFASFTTIRATTRESAESISVGIRSISQRLQRSTTESFFKDLGINLRDAEGQALSFNAAILAIQEGFKREGIVKGSRTYTAAVEKLGGVLQSSRVIPLLENQALTAQILADEMRALADSEKDTATAQDTLSLKLSQLQQVFASLFRLINEDSSFKSMADQFVILSKGMVNVLKVATELIPVLIALSVLSVGKSIKTGSGIGGLAAAGIGIGALYAAGKYPDIAGYKTGGSPGYTAKNAKQGIHVSGYGGGDSYDNVFRAEDGEFVLRKEAVRSIGIGNAYALNRLPNKSAFSTFSSNIDLPGFASGGETGSDGLTDELRKRIKAFQESNSPDYAKESASIKKALTRQSMQFHPDKKSLDPASLDKFKSLQELHKFFNQNESPQDQVLAKAKSDRKTQREEEQNAKNKAYNDTPEAKAAAAAYEAKAAAQAARRARGEEARKSSEQAKATREAAEAAARSKESTGSTDSAKPDTQAKAAAQAKADAKAAAQAKADTKAAAQAKADTQAKAAAQAKADAKAAAQAKTQAKADTQAKAAAQAKADAKAAAQAKADTKAAAQAKADTQAKAAAQAKTDAKAKATRESTDPAKRAQVRAKAEASGKRTYTAPSDTQQATHDAAVEKAKVQADLDATHKAKADQKKADENTRKRTDAAERQPKRPAGYYNSAGGSPPVPPPRHGAGVNGPSPPPMVPMVYGAGDGNPFGSPAPSTRNPGYGAGRAAEAAAAGSAGGAGGTAAAAAAGKPNIVNNIGSGIAGLGIALAFEKLMSGLQDWTANLTKSEEGVQSFSGEVIQVGLSLTKIVGSMLAYQYGTTLLNAAFTKLTKTSARTLLNKGASYVAQKGVAGAARGVLKFIIVPLAAAEIIQAGRRVASGEKVFGKTKGDNTESIISSVKGLIDARAAAAESTAVTERRSTERGVTSTDNDTGFFAAGLKGIFGGKLESDSKRNRTEKGLTQAQQFGGVGEDGKFRLTEKAKDLVLDDPTGAAVDIFVENLGLVGKEATELYLALGDNRQALEKEVALIREQNRIRIEKIAVEKRSIKAIIEFEGISKRATAFNKKGDEVANLTSGKYRVSGISDLASSKNPKDIAAASKALGASQNTSQVIADGFSLQTELENAKQDYTSSGGGKDASDKLMDTLKKIINANSGVLTEEQIGRIDTQTPLELYESAHKAAESLNYLGKTFLSTGKDVDEGKNKFIDALTKVYEARSAFNSASSDFETSKRNKVKEREGFFAGGTTISSIRERRAAIPNLGDTSANRDRVASLSSSQLALSTGILNLPDIQKEKAKKTNEATAARLKGSFPKERIGAIAAGTDQQFSVLPDPGPIIAMQDALAALTPELNAAVESVRLENKNRLEMIDNLKEEIDLEKGRAGSFRDLNDALSGVEGRDAQRAAKRVVRDAERIALMNPEDAQNALGRSKNRDQVRAILPAAQNEAITNVSQREGSRYFSGPLRADAQFSASIGQTTQGFSAVTQLGNQNGQITANDATLLEVQKQNLELFAVGALKLQEAANGMGANFTIFGDRLTSIVDTLSNASIKMTLDTTNVVVSLNNAEGLNIISQEMQRMVNELVAKKFLEQRQGI